MAADQGYLHAKRCRSRRPDLTRSSRRICALAKALLGTHHSQRSGFRTLWLMVREGARAPPPHEGSPTAADIQPQPNSVSNSNLTFRITMMPATIQAAAATGRDMTKLPIFRRSETNRTRGMSAHGSCIDSTSYM